MDNETLMKKARVEEIDRLVELNNRERGKLNDYIERLQERRDAMLTERDDLRKEQTRLLRELAS